MLDIDMIQEIQELKAAGLTLGEVSRHLEAKPGKAPSLPTIRKYYNMDAVPADFGHRLRKDMAFDVEPFKSTIVKILENNPRAHMSSVYDVLEETFIENGSHKILPANAQTLRNYVHHLKKSGAIDLDAAKRRIYDPVLDVAAGKQLIMDFGEQRCSRGLTVHFLCLLLRYSRLLGVFAQDHHFDSEQACRAIHRFLIRCGGRPLELVLDQDSVFIASERYGEVIETRTFADFTAEQDLKLWVCNKADPESKGPIENSVGFVKKNFFSARCFSDIEQVGAALPGWTARKNRRIHQATFMVPAEVFDNIEQKTLRPLLPSVYESHPSNLIATKVGSMPYIQYKSSKYSVARDLCFTRVYYKAIGENLYIYDGGRRHICTHRLNENKGSYNTLAEHAKVPSDGWMVIAERMRVEYNCYDFQHFIIGFKKENGRHVAKQLAAVEDYLAAKKAPKALVSQVMSICCKDWRYRFSQFKAVYELAEAGYGSDSIASFSEVEKRDLGRYQQAFEQRCAL
jgi:hypothetical protein